MQINMLLYIVNVFLGLSFAVLFLTGLLKFPELQQLFNLYSYHLPWRMISFVHNWCGMIFGVTGIIHLCLTRRWVAAMTKNYFFKKKLNKQ
jgi:hypothetical protein